MKLYALIAMVIGGAYLVAACESLAVRVVQRGQILAIESTESLKYKAWPTRMALLVRDDARIIMDALSSSSTDRDDA